MPQSLHSRNFRLLRSTGLPRHSPFGDLSVESLELGAEWDSKDREDTAILLKSGLCTRENTLTDRYYYLNPLESEEDKIILPSTMFQVTKAFPIWQPQK